MVRPKKAYWEQKRHASERNIEWRLTYEDWLEMWLVSGKWEQRGKGKGMYHVCRTGDEGPYSVANCRIDTMESNRKETRVYSDAEALEMYHMARRGDMTQREIGAIFGVHQSTVSKILNGQRRL